MTAAFQPTAGQLADALAHAAASQPKECCGLIAAGRYVPLDNKTTEHDSFVMDMRGYIAVARDRHVDAVVHSHIRFPPQPSPTDRAVCEKLGLPWLIVSWPDRTWRVIEPSGQRAPLVGREWVWGAQDCLAVVRDGIAQHAGITVPDFDRDWQFWRDDDLIGRHYRDAGFRRMAAGTPPRHCDVLGMQVNAPVVNHLALFLEPDMILHQLVGRLSQRQPYSSTLQKLTVLHLRHEMLA